MKITLEYRSAYVYLLYNLLGNTISAMSLLPSNTNIHRLRDSLPCYPRSIITVIGIHRSPSSPHLHILATCTRKEILPTPRGLRIGLHAIRRALDACCFIPVRWGERKSARLVACEQLAHGRNDQRTKAGNRCGDNDKIAFDHSPAGKIYRIGCTIPG